MKYSTVASILILSFILSVSSSYSADGEKLSPQIGTNPTINPLPLHKVVPQPMIQITSPTENQTLGCYSKFTIQWSKIGLMSEFVDISLLYEGEFKIASNISNNGTYEWLPSSMSLFSDCSYTKGYHFGIQISTTDKKVKSNVVYIQFSKGSGSIYTPIIRTH
jgi:hypothetical protein